MLAVVQDDEGHDRGRMVRGGYEDKARRLLLIEIHSPNIASCGVRACVKDTKAQIFRNRNFNQGKRETVKKTQNYIK